MTTQKVTKKWITKYFGIAIEPNIYSAFYQTDGGYGTRDFDRLPSGEYDILFRSSSKTYWGKLK